MKISTREDTGHVIVSLEGEVDLRHSPTLRKTLMDLMLDGRSVVVDLGQVAYMDSSGIAGLVEAYQMTRRNGGRFVLAAVSPSALRVLQLARLDKVFTLCDSVDAALALAP
jgi:anti-sigma B factor antagonist